MDIVLGAQECKRRVKKEVALVTCWDSPPCTCNSHLKNLELLKCREGLLLIWAWKHQPGACLSCPVDLKDLRGSSCTADLLAWRVWFLTLDKYRPCKSSLKISCNCFIYRVKLLHCFMLSSLLRYMLWLFFRFTELEHSLQSYYSTTHMHKLALKNMDFRSSMVSLPPSLVL